MNQEGQYVAGSQARNGSSQKSPMSGEPEGRKHEILPKAVVDQITQVSGEGRLLSHVGKRPIPTLRSVINIIEHLESILYPGYVGPLEVDEDSLSYRIAYIANRVYHELADQIAKSFRHECQGSAAPSLNSVRRTRTRSPILSCSSGTSLVVPSSST